MAMMACALSSSSIMLSSSTCTQIPMFTTHILKNNINNNNTIPLLGSSSSSSSSRSSSISVGPIAAAKSSNPVAEQWKEFFESTKPDQDLSRVPIEQRWMFTLEEAVGPDIWNKTWYPKAADHVNTDKKWYVVDATDLILGRMASTIAVYIRGKNLATYTPSVDMGAFVIVVNAENVAVSGKKRLQKLYRRHSGRPGGMKVETFDQLQKRIPERIIEHAVRGMLPKGRLGRKLFNHLKVYKGPDHPHQAQQPIELPLQDKRIRKEN